MPTTTTASVANRSHWGNAAAATVARLQPRNRLLTFFDTTRFVPPDNRSLQQLAQTASQLLRAGRTLEAIEAHERLLAARPHDPDGWYNLGYLQQQARRHAAALASYHRAIACGISRPEEVHLNRAAVLAEQFGRPDDAAAELAAALRCNPRYAPAWVNLGNIHEQRGERVAAIAAYERALAIDPSCTLALARLPALEPVSGKDDPLIDRLRSAIVAAAGRPADLADLGFGLGKALDDAGDTDAAFAAYTAANAASRATFDGLRYDAVAHERAIDRVIAAHPAAVAPADRGGDGGATEPERIFICGMFRSGSTLVEQILASHPRVTAGGEIDALPLLVHEHLGGLTAYAAPDATQLASLRAAYVGRVASLHPGAQVVTDKRPDNFLYVGLVKSMFPRARIVHTRRNPLDNCLSVFFLHLGPAMPYALDLADTAHWYRQCARLMAHWKSLYGDDIHDVDYDALVVDPRPGIAGLLAHCGLDHDDACLDFHRTRTVVRTPSAWQVREPLYRRASGRWRRYEPHLGPLRAALGDC